MRMSMSTTVSLCFSLLLRALFLQGPGAVFLVHGTRGRGPVPRDDKERFRVPESHDAPARHTSSTTTSSSSTTRPSRAAGESEFNVSRRTSRAAPPGGRRAHMRSGLLLDEPPPPSPGQRRPFAAVLAQCGPRPPGQQDAYDHDQQMAFAAAADESARKIVGAKQDQETAQEVAAVSCAELTELNQLLHQATCAGGGVARGPETTSGFSDSSPGTGPRGTDAVAAPAQEQVLSPVTSAGGGKAGGEQPEGGIASPSPAFLSRSLHKFLDVGYCDDQDDHLHPQKLKHHGKNGDEELFARGRRWLVCRRVQMLHEQMSTRIASGGCAAAEDHYADEAKSAVQVEELHRLRGELASALRIDATNDPTWIAARRIHAALTEAEEAHLSQTTGPDLPRSSSARLFRTSSTPPAGAPRLSHSQTSSSTSSRRDHSELKRGGSRHSLCSSAPTTAGTGGSGSCTRRDTETTLDAASVLLLQDHLADMQDNFSTPSTSGSAASPEMHSMISGEALDQLDADADELELTPAAGTAQWTPRHTPRRGQHSAGFLQRAADAPPASSSSSFLGLPPWGPPSSYARHDVTSSRLSDVPENPAGRSFLSDGTTASDLNRCDKAGGAPPGTMAGRSFGEASDNVEEWQRMQTPEDDLSTAVHPWVSQAQDQHQALHMTNANPSSHLGTAFNHTGHRETTDQRLQPAGDESANAFWSWTNAGHQGDYNHDCQRQPDMDGNMQPVYYGNAANDEYQYPCPPCYMLTSVPVVVPVTGVVVISPQQLQLATQQPQIPAIPRGARRIDSLSVPPSAVGTAGGGTVTEGVQTAGAHDGAGTDAQLQRSWWQWGWGH